LVEKRALSLRQAANCETARELACASAAAAANMLAVLAHSRAEPLPRGTATPFLYAAEPAFAASEDRIVIRAGAKRVVRDAILGASTLDVGPAHVRLAQHLIPAARQYDPCRLASAQPIYARDTWSCPAGVARRAAAKARMLEFPMRNVMRTLGAASIAVLAGHSSHAQQAPEAGPVIRVTSRLVEVEVLVSGNHGPVKGLTQDDFLVTDRGKRQAVRVLRAGFEGRPAGARANLPRDTFSNYQNDPEATSPSVTILLLDGLNTRFEDQNRARQQAVRALGQIKLGEKDRIAIYVLGKSLRVLSDFTDPAQTRRVLARYSGRLNTEMSTSEPLTWAVGDPLIDSFIDYTNEISAQAANFDRTSITLSALAAIASHAAAIPGRKNLVWVTGSLPLRAAAVASFLNSADLAVYPIDARGLIGLPPQWTAGSPAISRNVTKGQAVSLSPGGLGNFEDLANATGGRASINDNDLDLAVRNALQDAAAAYTLGFQPDAANLDGKYHELHVELRGKRPGVQLRYRRGYLAAKDSGSSDPETAQRMGNALWSPLEASALALSAKIVKPDPLNGRQREDLLYRRCAPDYVGFAERQVDRRS
jgi:VWFA-related protein